ncbi:hypothetical protein [Bradyrhizobium sp. ORS 375]|uniref:hypothetical protein n=1 Tax=Bradyrhizobium sp. (strain ORS 375) TaxID=566679 RepID=UPI0002EEA196|nr:hypothetical protein [Bradyrhizobium sp. ORS 375]
MASAAALGQIGSDALPVLMASISETLRRDAEASAWPQAQRDSAVILTDVVRAILSNDPQAILRFRQCTTDAVIRPLVWAARGDNQRLRVNAANILANVIDNTTVCFVLHHLRDSGITASGRANLLGITNSMASYAYRENVASIMKTLDIVNEQILNGIGFDQSRMIIRDISSRMAQSENKNVSLEAVSLQRYCLNYDFGAPLQ